MKQAHFFLITLILLIASSNANAETARCKISLHSLSLKEASPGDTLVLYGSWENEQGQKVPVINRGGQNRLEVIEWSPTTIRARIPGHLTAGDYRVGVYCRDVSQGATVSSGFKTLSVRTETSTETVPKTNKAKQKETKKQKASGIPVSYTHLTLPTKIV